MNLYIVLDANYNWGCFVFEKTRNRAKAAVARHFDMDYTEMRCKTLKRAVNVDYPMIVDCETDQGYDMVLACGYHYMKDEENETIF